jgi:hypothetical protein
VADPTVPPGPPITVGTPPGTPITDNRNFDSRIWQFPPTAIIDDPLRPGLYRGYIESANSVGAGQSSPTNPQGTFNLGFLYNPSTVSVSHSISSADQMIPPYLRQAADTGIPLRTSGGSVSLSLLFDRTYDVWGGQPGELAHDLGVLIDIHTLYGLTGITTPLSAAQSSSPAGSSSTGDDSGNLQTALNVTPNAVTGTMQLYPIWAVLANMPGGYRGLGPQTSQQFPDISLMRYFGYISSIDVAFTHFTQQMVPFRCAVGLSIQLMASAGYQ